MRKLLLCLTAAVAVAGCTSESDLPQVASDSAVAQPARTALSAAIGQATEASAGRSTAAPMADRGALLAFDAVNAPLQEGATKLYPIRLSEAHALNAASPGRSIAVATPSGKSLNFAYDSHSEDAQGNWTWVGTTVDGLSAVITFGEDAVFGQVSLPGAAPLQLLTRNGRTFLGVIDSARAKSGHLLRKGQPDVLIPQVADIAGVAAAAGATISAMKAAPAQPGFATKSSPANTIDVALGYTPGLVTSYGSVSAVNTRLTNLVATANAAYQRSQITPRIRLVHTLQVNYTDTNSNDTALNALSGLTCNPTCTSAPVPAELQPLRNARDQFGADLVSLVRPLRAPQQQGCGIAWLVGGELDTIDNGYAPFGYSVVSDGQDLDETDGNNYLCYVETLAHELGHNMGQAHNTQDANVPGAHTYSYGYRETSTTGFFTIMAYPLDNSSQFPISHFANPSVNDAGTGRVTGTATADNARSLNQTMPLVAQFRAAVVPFAGGARGDINGDGRSDIVWRNTSLAQMSYWLQNGPTRIGTGSASVVATSSIVGLGDFDGDGRADQLWSSSTNTHLWLFRSRSDGGFDYQFIDFYPAGWNVVGVSDLDGDGKADIVLRNESQGLMSYWRMNGATRISSGAVSIPAGNTVVGTGDFDGDGRGDLLWTTDASRLLWLYRSRSDGGFDYLPIDFYPTGWSVSGVTDTNGDGRADVIWRNAGTAQMSYWTMNGATRTGSGVATISATSTIVGTGDFDGDGRGDLLWTSSEGNFLWIYRSLGNGTFAYQFVDFLPAGWQVVNRGS